MAKKKTRPDVAQCFICKCDISEKGIADVKRVDLPTGVEGYVCVNHPGVSNLKAL